MDHDVYIQDENKLILCVIKERFASQSAKEFARDIRKKAYELGYNILYDVTNITVRVTIVDAYSFAQDIEKIYDDPVHRHSKAAFLYKSDAEFWKFYETTARNTGANVMMFRKKEKALQWLSSEESY